MASFRGSLLSYAIAVIAGGFAASLSPLLSTFEMRANAQTTGNATTELLVQPLSDLPGREVRITLLDREAGNSSLPHRHPGHHTFGYVVDGSYEFGVNGQPTRILKAGDTFYEPPGTLHSVSRNAS